MFTRTLLLHVLTTLSLGLGLAAQNMTTISIGGKQGTQSKIQWADNNDTAKITIDLRIRLDSGLVVHPNFSVEVESGQYTRPELAEVIAQYIRQDLINAGVPAAEANEMCSSNGGNSVHVNNTNPRDQPNGGGTPDAPIHIDHGSDAPIFIQQYIS